VISNPLPSIYFYFLSQWGFTVQGGTYAVTSARPFSKKSFAILAFLEIIPNWHFCKTGTGSPTS